MSEPSIMLTRMLELERRVAGFEEQSLKSGGSGGNSSGMEVRVAKLEAGMAHLTTDVGELRTDVRDMRKDIGGIRTTDFRLIFGAIIAVALGLAGLMAHGFHWI